MSTPDAITVAQLSRLIGTPDAPPILDVRTDEDHAADPRLLPASSRRDHRTVASWAVSTWADEFAGRTVAVACQRGAKLSQGVAAWLRCAGARAEYLEGGFAAWAEAGAPLVRPTHVPTRDSHGRTVWVTRTRPKIDRIACPWLIRRFVDPAAVVLFVTPAEVAAVAERFAATPFDIEGVFWSHRGADCTFDIMLEEFGLHSDALDRLAAIVRGADTARLDLAPQAAGLLAASLGLSRMYRDDLAQLDAAMGLYDAFYRWARDAAGETHNWPTHGTGARP
jgi:rhodanese-related sulfurtransferase